MTRDRIMAGVALVLWAGLVVPVGAGARMQTPCEMSGGKITPRYAETIVWLQGLADTSPLLTLTSFGVSPEGRDLPLVVVDNEGRFTAADHRDRSDHVVLLVQACVHAGESCGKDAGMALLRDVVAGQPPRAWLENVTLLFVPIFNVDGHERFSPYGRINQNGPAEMGWRVTSRNLNLNRDFLKADTAEMQAWLQMFNAWQPDFFVDIHSTDGADYQYAITYSVETGGNLEAGLADWTGAYRDGMCDLMEREGFPMAPYISFRDWHDPRSGLNAWAAGPRYSQGYAAVRNRPGLLIETHMLKDYAVRVESTRLLLLHTLDWLHAEAEDLRKLISAADRFTAGAEFRARPFALDFDLTDRSRTVDFLGFAYDKVTSDITGGDWFRYSAVPETMQIEFYDDLVPALEVRLPEAYVVPAGWTEVIDRLRYHGVAFTRLAEPVDLAVRTYRFSEAEWRERPYEGRHPASFAAEPLAVRRVFPAGSAVVDMNQPLARVAAHLLEPEGPDSLVRWGFFDAVFSRIEYVESYVIEQMIRQMLADDPQLATRLEARKAEDPDFAGNPWAIRYWFYEQTPYYDQQLGIYPVGLLDDPEIIHDLPINRSH